MGLSPAPHEHSAKAVDEKAPPGSLSRFQRLAARLFGVDRTEFREALKKDEADRRAKRGR